MSIFKPYMSLKKIEDIELSLLNHLKIKVILADIDNTLVEHGLDNVSVGVQKWLDSVKHMDIKIVLISNNDENRVRNFANRVNLDFIAKANKPLPFKVNNILKNFDKEEILFIGDQIFTDVIFANLIGIKSILLEPINRNEPNNIKFKRIFEKPLRKN